MPRVRAQAMRRLVQRTMQTHQFEAPAARQLKTSFPVLVRPVGPLMCNSTLLVDPVTKNAAVCDPGGDDHLILESAKQQGANITHIFVTHAHFDHIGGIFRLKEATNASICLHRKDKALWDAIHVQLQHPLFNRIAVAPKNICEPDIWLEDNQQLPMLNGVALHTPGHSAGSTCFYFANLKLLVAGDTLFHRSVGRTDLVGGDANAIRKSVLKLYTLPDDTHVVPGHGRDTTIGFEKVNNSVVRLNG